MGVKIEVGQSLPAIPGFVAAVEHSTTDKSVAVAIRVAPAAGKVRDVLDSHNVRTIRINIEPDVQVRAGDDIVVPASTIRRVSEIQIKNEETGVLTNMVKFDAARNPVLGPDGKHVNLLTVQVMPNGPLVISGGRVKADQVSYDLSPATVQAALAAW